MKKTFFIATVLLMTILAISCYANNLSISNVSLTDQNTTDNYIMVEFDISWDNSWRTNNLNNDGVTNWDAAWIFIKYKRTSDGKWYHATLNNTDGNHDPGSQTTNANVDATGDGKGVFYHRSGNGAGTFNSTNVQLRWQYGTDGFADNLDALVSSVSVFAIEMVYVPTGSFYLGSGGSEDYHFYKHPTTTDEFQVTSEGAINTGTTNNYLWAEAYMGADATIPVDFPKGYAAFYCMKYEITQEQYVDFLNTLTRTQQNTRTETGLADGVTTVTNRYVMANNAAMQYRNGIRCDATIHTSDPITFYCDYNGNGTGNESGDGQNIACNWLSWADGAAYSDWSGLRPMTELEYEKACRGEAEPVANEYAWGTTSIQEATGISNAGNINEAPSNSAANCIYNSNGSVQGPLRCGSCTSGTRSSMGASYYGIMELSGNLLERPVTVANSTGRVFTGVNGNGALLDNGNADASNWPGTDAIGSGFRGGDWDDGEADCRASDRVDAGSTYVDRNYDCGFRCVRSVNP